jgi:hypothetical protein
MGREQFLLFVCQTFESGVRFIGGALSPRSIFE